MDEYIFNQYGNQDFLNKSYAGRLNFYLKLSHVFITDIPIQLKAIESYALEKNYEGVRKIVHKSKNNFHWMGLHSISEKLKKVEQSCYEGSLDWLELEKLRKEMEIGLTDVIIEDKRIKVFLNHEK